MVDCIIIVTMIKSRGMAGNARQPIRLNSHKWGVARLPAHYE